MVSLLFGCKVLAGDIIGRRQYELVHIVQKNFMDGIVCVADTFG